MFKSCICLLCNLSIKKKICLLYKLLCNLMNGIATISNIFSRFESLCFHVLLVMMSDAWDFQDWRTNCLAFFCSDALNSVVSLEYASLIDLNLLLFLSCRFCTIAYLQQTWWFEVDGEVEFPFPMGTYSLFFRLQLGRAYKRFGRRICNTEHVHGWDIKPVQFQLWTSDGQYTASKCILGETGKWNYYHVGDFVVDNSNAPAKIKFSMTQIDCTHTKGGLCLDSVFIYPSEFRERLKRFWVNLCR